MDNREPTVLPASTDGAPAPAGMAAPSRAGFGVRVAAALIDAALLLPVYFALVQGAEWIVAAHLFGLRHVARLDPVFMSITIGNALVLAYSLFEIAYAATPGKMLLRLKIKSLDGAAATRGQLLARYALKHGARICGLVNVLLSIRRLRPLYAWAPLPVFRTQPLQFVTLRTIGELLWLFAVVGFFFTLGKTRQALYDRFTGTAVFRTKVFLPAKRGFEPLAVLAITDASPTSP